MFTLFYNLICITPFFNAIKILNSHLKFYNSPLQTQLLHFYNSNSPTLFAYYLFKYLFIPILLIIIITFLLMLILNRYGFEKKIMIKQEIDIKINSFLTEIIFSNFTNQQIKEKISIFKEHTPFHKKWCKIVILNKIITIKQNINGVNTNQLILIYKYFGFHKYSDKLIRSKSWEKKILGIYHYQILEYKIKAGHIRPHLNVKNKFLTSNALIAILSLSDKKFDFLIDYEKTLSAADELKILNIIYQKKSEIPEKINLWLSSKNSSIVILAIKLITHYRESLSVTQIKTLLESPNSRVRKETFLAIRNLFLIEVNSILIDHYDIETNKRNKISLLKTLAVIGDNDVKNFIVRQLDNEKDIEIKFEIVNCISKIDPSFFKNYKSEDATENDIINRIVLHINTPYLN